MLKNISLAFLMRNEVIVYIHIDSNFSDLSRGVDFYFDGKIESIICQFMVLDIQENLLAGENKVIRKI